MFITKNAGDIPSHLMEPDDDGDTGTEPETDIIESDEGNDDFQVFAPKEWIPQDQIVFSPTIDRVETETETETETEDEPKSVEPDSAPELIGNKVSELFSIPFSIRTGFLDLKEKLGERLDEFSKDKKIDRYSRNMFKIDMLNKLNSIEVVVDRVCHSIEETEKTYPNVVLKTVSSEMEGVKKEFLNSEHGKQFSAAFLVKDGDTRRKELGLLIGKHRNETGVTRDKIKRYIRLDKLHETVVGDRALKTNDIMTGLSGIERVMDSLSKKYPRMDTKFRNELEKEIDKLWGVDDHGPIGVNVQSILNDLREHLTELLKHDVEKTRIVHGGVVQTSLSDNLVDYFFRNNVGNTLRDLKHPQHGKDVELKIDEISGSMQQDKRSIRDLESSIGKIFNHFKDLKGLKFTKPVLEIETDTDTDTEVVDGDKPKSVAKPRPQSQSPSQSADSGSKFVNEANRAFDILIEKINNAKESEWFARPKEESSDRLTAQAFSKLHEVAIKRQIASGFVRLFHSDNASIFSNMTPEARADEYTDMITDRLSKIILFGRNFPYPGGESEAFGTGEVAVKFYKADDCRYWKNLFKPWEKSHLTEAGVNHSRVRDNSELAGKDRINSIATINNSASLKEKVRKELLHYVVEHIQKVHDPKLSPKEKKLPEDMYSSIFGGRKFQPQVLVYMSVAEKILDLVLEGKEEAAVYSAVHNLIAKDVSEKIYKRLDVILTDEGKQKRLASLEQDAGENLIGIIKRIPESVKQILDVLDRKIEVIGKKRGSEENSTSYVTMKSFFYQVLYGDGAVDIKLVKVGNYLSSVNSDADAVKTIIDSIKFEKGDLYAVTLNTEFDAGVGGPDALIDILKHIGDGIKNLNGNKALYNDLKRLELLAGSIRRLVEKENKNKKLADLMEDKHVELTPEYLKEASISVLEITKAIYKSAKGSSEEVLKNCGTFRKLFDEFTKNILKVLSISRPRYVPMPATAPATAPVTAPETASKPVSEPTPGQKPEQAQEHDDGLGSTVKVVHNGEGVSINFENPTKTPMVRFRILNMINKMEKEYSGAVIKKINNKHLDEVKKILSEYSRKSTSILKKAVGDGEDSISAEDFRALGSASINFLIEISKEKNNYVGKVLTNIALLYKGYSDKESKTVYDKQGLEVQTQDSDDDKFTKMGGLTAKERRSIKEKDKADKAAEELRSRLERITKEDIKGFHDYIGQLKKEFFPELSHESGRIAKLIESGVPSKMIRLDPKLVMKDDLNSHIITEIETKSEDRGNVITYQPVDTEKSESGTETDIGTDTLMDVLHEIPKYKGKLLIWKGGEVNELESGAQSTSILKSIVENYIKHLLDLEEKMRLLNLEDLPLYAPGQEQELKNEENRLRNVPQTKSPLESTKKSTHKRELEILYKYITNPSLAGKYGLGEGEALFNARDVLENVCNECEATIPESRIEKAYKAKKGLEEEKKKFEEERKRLEESGGVVIPPQAHTPGQLEQELKTRENERGLGVLKEIRKTEDFLESRQDHNKAKKKSEDKLDSMVSGLENRLVNLKYSREKDVEYMRENYDIAVKAGKIIEHIMLKMNPRKPTEMLNSLKEKLKSEIGMVIDNNRILSWKVGEKDLMKTNEDESISKDPSTGLKVYDITTTPDPRKDQGRGYFVIEDEEANRIDLASNVVELVKKLIETLNKIAIVIASNIPSDIPSAPKEKKKKEKIVENEPKGYREPVLNEANVEDLKKFMLENPDKDPISVISDFSCSILDCVEAGMDMDRIKGMKKGRGLPVFGVEDILSYEYYVRKLESSNSTDEDGDEDEDDTGTGTGTDNKALSNKIRGLFTTLKNFYNSYGRLLDRASGIIKKNDTYLETRKKNAEILGVWYENVIKLLKDTKERFTIAADVPEDEYKSLSSIYNMNISDIDEASLRRSLETLTKSHNKGLLNNMGGLIGGLVTGETKSGNEPTSKTGSMTMLSSRIAAKYLRKVSAEWKERLEGGNASGKSPEDFNQEQLAMGTKVEMEHTVDEDIATEIAMDHLTEEGLEDSYYTKLKEMEDQAKEEDEDEEDEDEEDEEEDEEDEEEEDDDSMKSRMEVMASIRTEWWK